MAPQKESTASYASGLISCIACIAFLILAVQRGFSNKNTMVALGVFVIASILNFSLSSSGYLLTTEQKEYQMIR